MNRVASLLKRLAGRDAPTNLEPFLSGQSQTICSARHCQATLRSSRTHHAALQRPLEIEGGSPEPPGYATRVLIFHLMYWAATRPGSAVLLSFAGSSRSCRQRCVWSSLLF
jgi:hypothetical protein